MATDLFRSLKVTADINMIKMLGQMKTREGQKKPADLCEEAGDTEEAEEIENPEEAEEPEEMAEDLGETEESEEMGEDLEETEEPEEISVQPLVSGKIDLREAVLWAEILGKPAGRKNREKRMERIYGDRSNAGRR